MHWYSGKTVLITGASGSIGSALATALAPTGALLVLSGRSVARLEAVARECRQAGAQVDVIPHDLGALGAAGELAERLSSRGHNVDVLVNNAGFGKAGPLVSQDVRDYEELITVNVTNLVSLSRHLLPGMIERGSGGVLNVASASSLLPIPHLAVYAASKAFVKRFSEALHSEVKDQGVHVTCVAPGAVESDFFFERAGMPGPAGGVKALDPNRVARQSLRALARNKRLHAPGYFDKFMVVGTRLAPTSLLLFLARKFMDRTG
jgi:uncharacterized protein